MKKVIITVPREHAPKLEPLLIDTLYFIEDVADNKRITVFVLDEMLEDMIEKTHDTLDIPEGSKFSRPLWTGIISRIQNTFGESDKNTIIEVYSPDFILSPFLENLKKESEDKKKPRERPSIEKMIQSTEGYSRFDLNGVVLAAIAGIVALIGLFLNNVGIIIGAMLISPLLGPIYALAITTAIGDVKKIFGCIRIIVMYVGMLIGIALVATFLLSLVFQLSVTDEIAARMVSSVVYIVMAILLGFATIVALSRGIPEGMAGVAIAAALLPPAVVTGIAMVIEPSGAFSALILTLQNVVGLIAGAVGAVIVLDIRPREASDQDRAHRILSQIGTLLILIMLVLIALTLLV
jgi:uncharacterized hydrophobic protein (TIGR00341 family)